MWIKSQDGTRMTDYWIKHMNAFTMGIVTNFQKILYKETSFYDKTTYISNYSDNQKV